MFVVTVRFTVRPTHETRFLERVSRQARESLATETACRRFDVCRSPDLIRVFLYEVYDDEAAFAAHLETPHFSAFDAETRGWVAEKTVARWTLDSGR